MTDISELIYSVTIKAHNSGARTERERIIKLLEAFGNCNCDQTKHCRCASSQGLTPVEVIRLIKRDTE